MKASSNGERVTCWYCGLKFDADTKAYQTSEDAYHIPRSSGELRVVRTIKYIPCPRCGMGCDNQEIAQRCM